MKKTVSYTAHRQDGILLNANESSAPFSEKIAGKIAAAVSSAALNRYPDSDQTELLAAYAEALGLKPSMLLAGNGSDQMLGYMIGTFLGKGKKLCTLAPDFSMYDYYAGTYEAEVIRFKTEEDGSFDTDAFIAFAKENGAGMILFSNPNNPTGHLLESAGQEKILQAFPEIPVVFDEAYIEFSRIQSSVCLIEKYPNLYVTRTLSKAYGLAGIRTGFLISNEENMAKLKKAFVPYALNTVSMKIASCVLKYHREIAALAEDVKAERERMQEALRDCRRLRIFPSEANFIYGKSTDKDILLNMLEEKNIVIRNYAGGPYFRITVGTKEENDTVLSVIRQFEEAI